MLRSSYRVSMEDLVFKITLNDENGDKLEFSVEEYLAIPMPQRVLMTTGPANVEYWDKAGEKVKNSKAIIFLGKKKRELAGTT